MRESIFEEIFRRIAAVERSTHNLLRVGTVESLDAANATVRVRIGQLLTPPIPWLTQRAGPNAKTFAAPGVGEQVLLLSPSGDANAAIALPAVYSAQFSPPAGGEKITRTLYDDGTTITYDSAAHALTANVQGTADVTTTGDANATIGGALTVQVTGDITAQTMAT
jgi:phage baseplate assembly protein V